MKNYCFLARCFKPYLEVIWNLTFSLLATQPRLWKARVQVSVFSEFFEAGYYLDQAALRGLSPHAPDHRYPLSKYN
jgi:hypothetical protein